VGIDVVGSRQPYARSQRPDQNSVCFLRSDVQHAELPALAVVALEILVGFGHVGDVHVGRVLENFLSGEAIEVTACIGSYPSRINDMSIYMPIEENPSAHLSRDSLPR